MPAGERLTTLSTDIDQSPEVVAVLKEVSLRGSWSEKDQEVLRLSVHLIKKAPPRPRILKTILDCWAHPIEFGERFLLALQAYYQSFFAEEESRIRPALQNSLAYARERSKQVALPDLLEELSQGVRFASLGQVSELVLAPSYWSTPLIIYGRVSDERTLILYGARPATDSLVPGEVVPDALLQSLKALADPTRLRILSYLAEKPHTPAQLSRRLRLRPPTVIHHLNVLRSAGLVQLTLETEGERCYAARTESLGATFHNLQDFMKGKVE
jgi:DNA-binding transcriptional ArsR family regulator